MAGNAPFTHAMKQYFIVTGNYWLFTLIDGALRMLVVLYFHQLGYSSLEIAMLFLFYEFFGVVTNLVGGWLGARIGLNKTMNIGLCLQVVALLLLTVPEHYLTIPLVMFAQALSGIAKDLNKMSAKSSVKSLVRDSSEQSSSPLFKWVAVLTGSKNALKGVGFFLGGVLLTTLGFKGAMFLMACVLAITAVVSITLLDKTLGKAKNKAKFSQVFSKNRALNYLSAARMALFAARDVWFVVALPVFFVQQFNWQHEFVGGFMALWVIGYGFVQGITPKIMKAFNIEQVNGRLLAVVAFYLSIIALFIGYCVDNNSGVFPAVIGGLLLYGVVFAINSSLHSYKVVSLARDDGVSMDIGFYYMANAIGRLLGTVLSGAIFQWYGFASCLLASALLTLISAIWIKKLDHEN